MDVFERIGDEYEQVVFSHEGTSGLRAIIAIHSTRLGPALGGTRFYPYLNEDEAIEDVLRLARGMTYKAAAAGLDLGGGKAVIIGDPAVAKNEALLRAYARFVQSLGGRYVTAEDVGTTQTDMDLIRRETRFVTGVSEELGGSGDPSAATAYGVRWAMKAVARYLWGSTALEGRHICVSGVGKVGSHLVGGLVEEGARVSVADVVPAAVERMVHQFGAESVAVEKAHGVDCDIYAPCALGAALNSSTIPELRCAAVVGSANNQLAEPDCADLLHESNVIYAPDYVVNAGGLINIAEEMAPGGYHRESAYVSVQRVADNIERVLSIAEAEAITTSAAADRLAELRIESLGHVAQIRIPRSA
ncbi:MAG TPA: Glu/Leu/Phe/Val dehydrogenase dimerization domain-containing protein [Acidimicrobiales bacterium]|nr:Glu/Leu/Phe/Val dehydrogenase dimerization domain-containing protein [Acidimicrobiales bacterium]